MTSWADIVVTDGTGQADRQLSALAPDYIRVDERSFETHLAIGMAFAERLKFFDALNRHDGDWSSLFRADASALMADILATDLEKLEHDFLIMIDGKPGDARQFIEGIKQKFTNWLDCLRKIDHPSADELAKQIELLINASLRTPQSLESFPTAAVEDNTEKQRLQSTFRILMSALAHLRADCQVLFQKSLATHDHDPALGLLFTFFRLLVAVQSKLNQFPERHIDFYYERVLGLRPYPQKPGRVLLALEHLGPGPTIHLEAGTRFLVSHPSLPEDLAFDTGQDLAMPNLAIGGLYTAYLVKDKRISPGHELNFVTAIKSRRLIGDDGSEIATSWPLFGDALTRPDDVVGAPFGFAVGSPVLAMKEGTRSIALTISFEKPETHANDLQKDWTKSIKSAKKIEALFSVIGKLFRAHLLAASSPFDDGLLDAIEEKFSALQRNHDTSLAEHLARIKSEIGDRSEDERQSALYQLLKHAFTITLTGTDGWIAVDRYWVTLGPPSSDQPSLVIETELPVEAPSVVDYDAALHGAGWDLRVPAMKVELSPEADFCAYSLFEDLKLHAINIDVVVQGHRDLQIANQESIVDSSKPFAPFGARPDNGDYFIVGSYEIARKHLTKLNFDLEWIGLPEELGGFRHYFASYGRAFDDDSLRVAQEALRDGRWWAEPVDTKPQRLFGSAFGGELLSPTHAIESTVLRQFRPVGNDIRSDDFTASEAVRNGLFKFTLNGPPGAFGHERYPLLLAESLRRWRKKKPPPLPYTPMLAKISINYRASAHLQMNQPPTVDSRDPQNVMLHLNPFGHLLVLPSKKIANAALFPTIHHRGQLFIGLSGDADGTHVSLLFDIAVQGHCRIAFQPPRLSWRYLTATGWRPLERRRVVGDTTGGLMTSGIISLQLPQGFDQQSTAMPGHHLSWLCVGVDRNVDSFPKIRSLRLHGVEVSRHHDSGASEAAHAALPPDARWQIEQTVGGLGAITQIDTGLDHHPSENKQHFRRRISERLSHKNRAVTPRDYEWLILERFPELEKVKCLPHMTPKSTNPAPGQILIVAVPRVAPDTPSDSVPPMADNTLLNRVESYVHQLSSPFVKIQVRNPAYDRIQIRAHVQFSTKGDEGARVRKLHLGISDYLSPWRPGGCRMRFGWKIRADDVASFVRRQPDVKEVGALAMLQVTEADDQYHGLEDSAGAKEVSRVGGTGTLRAAFPWSLAVPTTRHMIEVDGPDEQPVRTVPPAGIKDLEIGSTLVIAGGAT